ncbi:MAG: TatA/E family twin arginine-targeting protein translocase [Vulcanococcus sp.]|jgi:sec-independent protein translocase protein TatA|uniref:TatA/E family twin arginine-targeting protein translocase n=1 Tax=Vulcanococcus sp. TaxID=2856995 RepID=UPI0025F9A8D0|nr:TatA/E family twin arginine-targeting protein translocase [Vulcanococcus sp.]MBW0180330.1 TatA/E family twin arginine-targeting protein translocase [Vulcanococcus sp.]
MNVFGVGLPELAVIAAIGLLVFGPKRLPELGKTLGRTLKGFQSASSEFEKEFRKAVDTVEAEVTATSVLPAEQAQAAAPEPSAQPQASSAVPEHSPEA